MKLKSFAVSLAALSILSAPAFAGEDKIMITDPYARSAAPGAKTGAAFMEVMNMGTEADRLIDASSNVAKRVELHTHIEASDGVMQMRHVPDGFDIPAGESIMLMRGGKHVMLMGLTESLDQDETIEITLTFEKAGEMVVEVPVDLTRKPAEQAHGHGHSN